VSNNKNIVEQRLSELLLWAIIRKVLLQWIENALLPILLPVEQALLTDDEKETEGPFNTDTSLAMDLRRELIRVIERIRK